MSRMLIATILAAVCVAATAPLHAANDHASHAAAAHARAQAAPPSEGVVRSVDSKQGEITLKHGPITNLGMPAMTMSFKAKDRAMLDRVKPGDKVRFVADQSGGELIVVQIERVQ